MPCTPLQGGGTPPQHPPSRFPAFPRLYAKPQVDFVKTLGAPGRDAGTPPAATTFHKAPLPSFHGRGVSQVQVTKISLQVSALGGFSSMKCNQPPAPRALSDGRVSSVAVWADVAPARPAGEGLNRTRALQAPGGFPGGPKGP